jgi:hypothetical protein
MAKLARAFAGGRLRSIMPASSQDNRRTKEQSRGHSLYPGLGADRRRARLQFGWEASGIKENRNTSKLGLPRSAREQKRYEIKMGLAQLCAVLHAERQRGWRPSGCIPEFRGSGSFGEADLLHVGRQIPIV